MISSKQQEYVDKQVCYCKFTVSEAVIVFALAVLLDSILASYSYILHYCGCAVSIDKKYAFDCYLKLC